jgi:hypothetical protein
MTKPKLKKLTKPAKKELLCSIGRVGDMITICDGGEAVAFPANKVMVTLSNNRVIVHTEGYSKSMEPLDGMTGIQFFNSIVECISK